MTNEPRSRDTVTRSRHGGEAHGELIKRETDSSTTKSHKVAASKENPAFSGEADVGKRAAPKAGALRTN